MGLGYNDPWVESHMWPQKTWGQKSWRGQWPLVSSFCRYGVKSNITMIAKRCDHESRQDPWFENCLVWNGLAAEGNITFLIGLIFSHFADMSCFASHVMLVTFGLFLYSKWPIKRHSRLTNKGRRHQQLFWSTEGFNPIKRQNKNNDYNPLDVKYQVMTLVIH